MSDSPADNHNGEQEHQDQQEENKEQEPPQSLQLKVARDLWMTRVTLVAGQERRRQGGDVQVEAWNSVAQGIQL